MRGSITAAYLSRVATESHWSAFYDAKEIVVKITQMLMHMDSAQTALMCKNAFHWISDIPVALSSYLLFLS